MKKGQQSAAGAAILLIVLATMILFYLLLLPDAEREGILGDGGGDDGGGGSPYGDATGFQNVLLSQVVGRLNPPSPNEVDHTIPSFTIFTSVNAKELARKSNMIIQNGAFKKNAGRMIFSYDESTTQNVMLSFNVKKTGGNLIIYLNEEEIFNAELDSGSPPPIHLPPSLLQPTNELTFEASGSGAFFWSVNTHELYNIILSGEVTDRSAASAAQHFSLTGGEYDAMQFGEITFLPNCDTRSAGRLTISVNNHEMFSGFPDCGVPNKIEVARDILKSGDNTLTFVSSSGQYLVDLVKMTTKMVGQDVPVFYFNIPNYLYDRYYFNDALLFLTIRFTDFRSLKTGVLNINGFEMTFSSQDIVFQTQIDPEFILPGPNSLMIIPQGIPLDIAELRVETS